MISDKGSKYISIIGIFLAVIFVFVSMFSINSIDLIETDSNNLENNVEDVLDKNTITDINIKIDESDWNWLIENATDEEYRNADVTINGETFYNVGVRPKGNSSLSSVANDDTTDRYSLKIDFGEFVDGQTYHGIRQLALNNNIFDPTYMKEVISYDVYDFLGVATPEYSYSNIKINGEEWGLYLSVEVIDERFIEKNYGTNDGNLYKPETSGGVGNKGGEMPPIPMDDNKEVLEESRNKEEVLNENNLNFNNIKENNLPNKQVEGNINPMPNDGAPGQEAMGQSKNNEGADLKYVDDNVSSYSALRESAVFKNTTDKDFESIIKMMKSLNNGEDIENYLNVDEVLKYFAVNTFLVNLDSYSGGMYHNYYLYENNGVSEIIPWDLNMSFGGFSMNDGNKIINFPIDYPVTGDLEDAPLIGKLLDNGIYKEKYHDYLEEIAEGYFNSGIFTSTIMKYNQLIGDCVKIDPTAFYSYEEYENGLKELLIFGEDRTKSIESQLNGEQPSTEYGSISTTLNADALGKQNRGKEPNNMANLNKDNNGMNNKIEGNKNNQKGNEEQMGDLNNRKPMPNGQVGNKPESSNINIITYAIIGALSVVLLISIIFVQRYKRKKY